MGNREKEEEALARVTARDVEVLEFVARYGVVPRDAVVTWAGTARSMTARREKRLLDAGLVCLTRLPYRYEPFLLATRSGLQLCTRDDLPVAKASPDRLAHFAAAARLGARLERAGEILLSERELLSHERALGERNLSVRLANGHLHRPDMIIVRPGNAVDEWGRSWAKRKPTVLEVELTPKGGRRLDRILSAWRGEVAAGRFAAVRYYCSAQALPYVQRSAERIGFGPEFNATLLPADCLPANLQRRRPGRRLFRHLMFLSKATQKISAVAEPASRQFAFVVGGLGLRLG